MPGHTAVRRIEGDFVEYRVTVRYGMERLRYHLDRVEAESIREAMTQAARELPDEVASQGDLVEIRPAVDPEARGSADRDG